MSHKPYMPLYISEYLADTAHFSTLAHGAYMLLIMNYWQTEKPLPEDDKKLAAITRLSVANFKKINTDLKKMFFTSEGRLVHKRIEKELAIFREKSELARVKAGKRWEGKGENSYAAAMPQQCRSIAAAMPRQCYTEAEAEITDQEFKNCSKAVVTETTTSAPAVIAADFKNVKNYFIEQCPAFFHDLPTTLKFWSSPKLRGMLSCWAKEGVTLEDVQAAVAHQRSKDDFKENPYYYAQAAIEFARERRKFGKYQARGSPKSKHERLREEADRNVEIALQQARDRGEIE